MCIQSGEPQSHIIDWLVSRVCIHHGSLGMMALIYLFSHSYSIFYSQTTLSPASAFTYIDTSSRTIFTFSSIWAFLIQKFLHTPKDLHPFLWLCINTYL